MAEAQAEELLEMALVHYYRENAAQADMENLRHSVRVLLHDMKALKKEAKIKPHEVPGLRIPDVTSDLRDRVMNVWEMIADGEKERRARDEKERKEKPHLFLDTEQQLSGVLKRDGAKKVVMDESDEITSSNIDLSSGSSQPKWATPEIQEKNRRHEAELQDVRQRMQKAMGRLSELQWQMSKVDEESFSLDVATRKLREEAVNLARENRELKTKLRERELKIQEMEVGFNDGWGGLPVLLEDDDIMLDDESSAGDRPGAMMDKIGRGMAGDGSVDGSVDGDFKDLYEGSMSAGPRGAWPEDDEGSAPPDDGAPPSEYDEGSEVYGDGPDLYASYDTHAHDADNSSQPDTPHSSMRQLGSDNGSTKPAKPYSVPTDTTPRMANASAAASPGFTISWMQRMRGMRPEPADPAAQGGGGPQG
eukprot:gnl/TRDRNA2_/TRDRNA2_154750_c3_seq1.p1 gnl/TRDRNA2_/TRDRNA2_154750_c3~~gnl/TRDRNA2_/TRDRNA2_154750_c3_seq1.p1  ORF type:complete len:460 (-),score=93.21 gnl/TRDRNA2_/TRDRNA2_154750_c3_seq1:104-1363(-)